LFVVEIYFGIYFLNELLHAELEGISIFALKKQSLNASFFILDTNKYSSSFGVEE
jgi:hypothetical protein